jgi:hypothetical protein
MDTQTQINILKAQVEQLTMVVNSLRNSSSIPFDIGVAFGDRLGGGFQIQGLGGSAVNKAVNESGSGSYSVADAMAGSATAIFNGTQIYIPFYV